MASLSPKSPKPSSATLTGHIPRDECERHDSTIMTRSYQREMFEESMKANIIVAMDTGTGKTHVASLRIREEIKAMPANKEKYIVWFLTPNVQLCMQQLATLESFIRSVQMRSLTSADKPEKWSSQEGWDTMLKNIKVVVATAAILQDALSHNFVKMESLALLVFDEAHNCTGNSPGSQVMKFYHANKRSGKNIPHILGLSASPIKGSDLNSMEDLEETLDAKCRTPLTHKGDILSHANRPTLVPVYFNGDSLAAASRSQSITVAKLSAILSRLSIEDDPDVKYLRSRTSEGAAYKLKRILETGKTFIRGQLQTFIRRSHNLGETIGEWAAEFYATKIIESFLRSVDTDDSYLQEWESAKKRYLAGLLRPVHSPSKDFSTLPQHTVLSNRLLALISELEKLGEDVTGIIYVQERATAYVLSHVLSMHSRTGDKLRFDFSVGASKREGIKRDICDLIRPTDAANTLKKFREGVVNILIGTASIQEGIDVPKCNVVICFDALQDLRSFIQWRGRARQRDSRLVVLLDSSSKKKQRDWEALEREMKKKYEDEEREEKNRQNSLRNLEKLDENQSGRLNLKIISSIGAQIDQNQAKGHLQHFCAKVSSTLQLPEYICREDPSQPQIDDKPALKCTVILPTFLHPSLRRWESKYPWYSEKNATKDAALQAYRGLYNAGLLNENLLPLEFPLTLDEEEELGSTIKPQNMYDPWPDVAKDWENGREVRHVLRLIDENKETKCEMEMLAPLFIPSMDPIIVHWDSSTRWKINITVNLRPNVSDRRRLADHTSKLLSLAFGHYRQFEDKEHVIRFRPKDLDICQVLLNNLSLATTESAGCKPGSLVRDPEQNGRPYIVQKPVPKKVPVEWIRNPHRDYGKFSEDECFVALEKWPHRMEYLRRPSASTEGAQGKEECYYRIVPRRLLQSDPVPMEYSLFGLFIPSILHEIENRLIVQKLCSTVLAKVDISTNYALIATALTTPVSEAKNNHKLGFLGNSILKFLVSVFITVKYPLWPSGYVTAKKKSLLWSCRLCKFGLDRELDQFIFNTIFTGSKWRPLYVDSVLEQPEPEPEPESSSESEIGSGIEKGPKPGGLSIRTIASVVEALVGAGWQMGGYSSALAVVKAFISEMDMGSLESGRIRLNHDSASEQLLPEDLRPIEALAEYTFKKKSLLIQAMTHGSDMAAELSYGRLAFLGDALVENIITTELLQYEDGLSHSQMHLYRTALLNNHYLGYVALTWCTTQTKFDLRDNGRPQGPMLTVRTPSRLPLWKFMRHFSKDVARGQTMTATRFNDLRNDIATALNSGKSYPWTLLITLHPNEFFSDLIKSVIAAVWIDSGSINECKSLMERMAILPLLRRLVTDKVYALHPIEKLAQLISSKELRREVVEKENDEKKMGWSAAVYEGQTPLVEDVWGESAELAETLAAEKVLSLERFLKVTLGQ